MHALGQGSSSAKTQSGGSAAKGSRAEVVPPAGFKYLVTEMVCWAAGGPQKYTGRPMKDSHRSLMITAPEWEAFLDDLQQTLDKFRVPQAEQAELKAIVASTHGLIFI